MNGILQTDFFFVQLLDGKATITNEQLANQIQTFIVTTVDGQVKLMTYIILLPSSFVYYIYRNNFGIIYFDNYYFITNSVFLF